MAGFAKVVSQKRVMAVELLNRFKDRFELRDRFVFVGRGRLVPAVQVAREGAYLRVRYNK